MTVLTGVGGTFTAKHRDPNGFHHGGELHEHTWDVEVWHRCEHENDAVVLQNHLKGILGAWHGTELPNSLSRGEYIAAAVAEAIGNLSPPSCARVLVSRHAEHLYAEWTP